MLHIAALEGSAPTDQMPSIEQAVIKWGDYLDYMNSFYLLLDSATIEIMKLSYFNLHEITNRDAFRVAYKNGQSEGENVAVESIASVFQMGRYLSTYRDDIPIEYHSLISMRQVISLDVIQHASSSFRKVASIPGLAKTLASFAKSLSEYKVGNYETSIILSWFIVEAALSHLWKSHVDSLNSESSDGRKRINRERRDFLTGRDFTISMVSNLLELWGELPNLQFQDIDLVRGFRNKIVHGHNFAPDAAATQLAMKTAQGMIERLWGLSFRTNMSYSVSGI